MANKTVDEEQQTEVSASDLVSKNDSEGKRQALEVTEDAREKEFLQKSFSLE